MQQKVFFFKLHLILQVSSVIYFSKNVYQTKNTLMLVKKNVPKTSVP